MLKADCNPQAGDKATGDYYPRLTLIKAVRKNGIEIFMHIELSLPKLVYGNNFDELEESDFDYLCLQLHRRLQRYGVIVESPQVIAAAAVKTVHYSKNIALTDYVTASSLIKDLSKANISTRQDVNTKDYRNTGEAFKLHTNTWEFIIYDKMKDLQKGRVSEKRAIEKDYYSQLSIFDEQKPMRPFEVIRLEARYNDKQKIKQGFKQAGVEPLPELTFKALYSQKLSQTMLQYEMQKIKDSYPAVLLGTTDNIEDLYTDLTLQNPNATLKAKFEAIGYKSLLNEMSSREIRTIGKDTPAQWYKLQKRVNALNLTMSDDNCFTRIDNALQQFKPLRLKHYLRNAKG